MTKSILVTIMLLFSIITFSQVVINELDCDTPSTDDKEFIELKSEIPNFLLDGYVLVLFNGSGSQMNLSYYVIDLDGFKTDENGLIVIGNSLVSPVPDKFLPDNIFQNGPDGVAIYQGSSSDFPNLTKATKNNLIDALVYDTADADATELMFLLGVSAQIDEDSNNLKTTQSIQRKNDGSYEIKLPTPGKNNDNSGFTYNGLKINIAAIEYAEGEVFQIKFTSEYIVDSDLNFSFTLNSGAFTSSDFSGNLSVSIPKGSNSTTTLITLIDDNVDEGDEIAKIKFGSIPSGFNRLNDNIEIRIIDNDYTILPWGTPLNPTFGKVIGTAPDGYYLSLEGKSGIDLKKAIQDIIANPLVVHAHNYGDIETILKKADQNPLNSNQVWLMYVEKPKSKLDFQENGINTGKWNREHIYPQSRGGFTDGTSDIPDGINVWLPTNANDILAAHADAHHIRAEDGPENSIRNNKDYGEYLGPTDNKGSWKGDVARALFYMAIRYNGLEIVQGNPSNTTVGQLGDLDLLLQWNKTDPSDDFEMNRNNYIYTWQLNRNPFIDYPDLADYLWGDKVGQKWYSTLSTKYFQTNTIEIYPNPTKGTITISGISKFSLIEIYNISGSKLQSSYLDNNSQLKLNLANGIYFVKITTNEETVIKKIIIK